ncbi:unnamed protein product, partial [Ectocarpus sp. 12 AP-2014]
PPSAASLSFSKQIMHIACIMSSWRSLALARFSLLAAVVTPVGPQASVVPPANSVVLSGAASPLNKAPEVSCVVTEEITAEVADTVLSSAHSREGPGDIAISSAVL